MSDCLATTATVLTTEAHSTVISTVLEHMSMYNNMQEILTE